MDASFLQRPDSNDLAYVLTPGRADLPAVMFCTGFRSDMGGTKAVYLEQACRARGQTFLRFDYSGHGQSGGVFADCTLSTWINDARAMLYWLDAPRVVLVGSSMGGWVSLALSLAHKNRIRGMVGVAAAPDFTKDMRVAMTPAQLKTLEENGVITIPNHYSADPYMITHNLLDDGDRNCLLGGIMDLDIPVRLVHGMRDLDVPWQTAWRIRNALSRPEMTEVILVEEGDHRLSRPEDLALIDRQVQEISGACI
jgi:pimeloyl-ACP methyl ester carboxylesterase